MTARAIAPYYVVACYGAQQRGPYAFIFFGALFYYKFFSLALLQTWFFQWSCLYSIIHVNCKNSCHGWNIRFKKLYFLFLFSGRKNKKITTGEFQGKKSASGSVVLLDHLFYCWWRHSREEKRKAVDQFTSVKPYVLNARVYIFFVCTKYFILSTIYVRLVYTREKTELPLSI